MTKKYQTEIKLNFILTCVADNIEEAHEKIVRESSWPILSTFEEIAESNPNVKFSYEQKRIEEVKEQNDEN